jgi:hypothetical protein
MFIVKLEFNEQLKSLLKNKEFFDLRIVDFEFDCIMNGNTPTATFIFENYDLILSFLSEYHVDLRDIQIWIV